MATCPSCRQSVPGGARFCPRCGGAVAAPDASPTISSWEPDEGATSPDPAPTPAGRAPSSRPASRSSRDERFAPGVVILERYRIVSLLGRGGMGEVYRADDLRLDQQVALKFLPLSLAGHPGALERLHAEVRTARQVSHPSVCRVYDVAEFEGQTFLTMEYVDGEDLSSLLRRIGRLPHDKALEVSRQVCAGLAAAHDRGVLHRDLKPANIMIDADGRARVMDFGLAVLQEGHEDGRFAGTPEYAAPEQLREGKVSVRSDVYALGLVLLELFTGRRALRGSIDELRRLHDSATPESITSDSGEVDESVLRVVRRCLEREPSSRPPTALAVAAALPGGDPLAAALAAGETPSPEMVAASGETGAMRPRNVAILVGLTLAALAALLAMSDTVFLHNQGNLEKPPAVLADAARSAAAALGHPQRPVDSAFGFYVNGEHIRHIERSDRGPRRWDALTGGAPGSHFFWYREHPTHLLARVAGDNLFARPRIQLHSPSRLERGAIGMGLDPRGRLLWFNAFPARFDDASAHADPPGWPEVFALAGLDIEAFTPTEPRLTPLHHADRRAAWEGFHPDAPETPIRVEAGSIRDQIVSFSILWPWEIPAAAGGAPDAEASPNAVRRAIAAASTVISLLLLGGGALIVWHNLRTRRGDRAGAMRFATIVGLLHVGRCVLEMHFTTDFQTGFASMVLIISVGVLYAALYWALYVGMEPYIRRFWPQSIVSWSRLMMGRVRDPLVAKDTLVGVLAGVVGAIMLAVSVGAPRLLGEPAPRPIMIDTTSMLGPRFALAELVSRALGAVSLSIAFVLLFTLTRLLLRKPVLAAAALWLLLVLTSPFVQTGTWIGGAIGVPAGVALVWVILRYGMLSLLVAAFVGGGLLWSFPITTDADAWFVAAGWLPVVLVVGLALAAAWGALGGKGALRLPA